MKKFVEKMKNFLSMNAEAKSGFTLVELIVVIAILAILAGVAIPAYSGYVEKAKKAEDEQLLATVNTAFAAACIENGTDVHSLKEIPTIKLTDDKAVESVSMYNDEFQKYYEGNEGKFEVYKSLYFSREINAFQSLPTAYEALLEVFDENDINALNASGFVTAEGLGISNLMNKVDFVSTLAASLAGDGGSIDAYLMGSIGMLAANMGYDMENDEDVAEFEEKWANLVNSRVSQVDVSKIDGYDQMTDEEKAEAVWERAQFEVAANNLVVQAAGNLPTDSTTALNQLANTTNFVELMKNEENGLTNAAMAFGLYTAYAHSLPAGAERDAAIAKTNDPLALLRSLDDTGFRSYLSNADGKGQAQKDLDGYLASMNMINDAQKDSSALDAVLVNGFNDEALLGLMQQVTNK